MLYVSDSLRSDGPLASDLGTAWQDFAAAVAPEHPSHEASADTRYFQDRAKRELELAAAANDPKAEAIHLELVHAYRLRLRQAQPLPEIFSWVDEGGANLPWD